jgi:hypothetical protein
MPKPKPNPEAALEKLGQRLRAGMAKKHPAQNLDAVRGAVREQYEQEQVAERSQPAPDASKGRHRQPPEPEPEP